MVELLLQSNADPTVIGPNEATAYTIARDVAKRTLVAALILEGTLPHISNVSILFCDFVL